MHSYTILKFCAVESLIQFGVNLSLFIRTVVVYKLVCVLNVDLRLRLALLFIIIGIDIFIALLSVLW